MGLVLNNLDQAGLAPKRRGDWRRRGVQAVRKEATMVSLSTSQSATDIELPRSSLPGDGRPPTSANPVTLSEETGKELVQLFKLLADETDKWGKVVKFAGAKVD